MSTFKFNRLYIIESLQERLTGKELYDDLIKWQEYKYSELQTNYFPVENKTELFAIFDRIKKECQEQGCCPVLHFEMHGDSKFRGLVLNSNELVAWEELYIILREINFIVRNNLFLTLAVCHGAYLMQIANIHLPAPFYGFIGSFDEIYESDLYLRYNEFYAEFFSSFQIHLALERFHTANPDMPSTYRFINSEETFCTVYKNYIKKELSLEGKKRRAKQVIQERKETFMNRTQKRDFEKRFVKEIEKTKDKYYKEAYYTFFMINEYPENRERFLIPETFADFIKSPYFKD